MQWGCNVPFNEDSTFSRFMYLLLYYRASSFYSILFFGVSQNHCNSRYHHLFRKATSTHTHKHAQTHMGMFLYTSTSIYLSSYTYMYVCTYKHIYTAFTNTRVLMHTYMSVSKHRHTFFCERVYTNFGRMDV